MNVLTPVDSERAVVGILAGGTTSDAGAARQLTREDFSDPDCACIFEACSALQGQRKTVSNATLDEYLTHVHGSERAAQLMQTAMTATRENRLFGWKLPDAVRAVKDGAQRRAACKIGEALSRGAVDEMRSLDDLMNQAREHLRKNASASGGYVTLGDAMIDALERIERQEKPIPTGIVPLDRILCGGLHRGELVVLGARPSVGKSSVLQHMAVTAAKVEKYAAVLSLEMPREQIGERALSNESGVNCALLRNGDEIPADLWTMLADVLSSMGEAAQRVLLFDDHRMTVEQLTTAAMNLVDQKHCDVLFVDYLQKLQTSRRTAADFERLGAVSHALKNIALDLNIPVVCAAQLRRQNNGGILRASAMDELRGSGDIEQDADVVILMHRIENAADDTLATWGYITERPSLWDKIEQRRCKLLSLNVAKNRQGGLGRAWVVFDPSRTRFFDPREVCEDDSV